MKVAGFDPSLSNFGIAIADWNEQVGIVKITELHLVKTVSDKAGSPAEVVLRRSNELYRAARQYAAGCELVFAELPTGGRNASTAFALGAACVATLVDFPTQVVTVGPYDVKRAVSNGLPSRQMDKEAMVAWAMKTHPEAPWPTYVRDGVTCPVTDVNHLEHLADAIAVIYAGIQKVKVKYE